MEILTSLSTKLAVDIIKWLGSQGIHNITKSDYTDFENELYKVIDASLEIYKKKYGSTTLSGKIHFCDSQIILSELIKFRLSRNPQANEIIKVIQNDARIETPTEYEMGQFLEIFSENVKKSAKLIKLNIENYYKEEIFNISAQLNAVAAAINDLKKEGPKELIEEWISRLDEVTSNIEKFKPKTALDILERLEKRIVERGISVSNGLKGKIIYLKAICLNEIHLGEIRGSAGEQFIKAYNYLPDNIEFKANAGLSYLVLDDTAKAEKIANEILEKEEYHSGAWALKLFLKDKNFRSFLPQIPMHVKNKREFKAQVGYWILSKHYVGKISELDKLGLNFEITDKGEPTSITSKNKWYWMTVITYLINKLYELNPMLNSSGFDSKMNEDTYFKYTHSILKKLTTAVEGSEIEENHAWYKFQMLYMDYVLSQDKYSVHLMETTFYKIKNKISLEVLQMAQVYNSFGTTDHIKKAVKVIDDFGEIKNEVLSLFNSNNHLNLKDSDDAFNSFKNYLTYHSSVDYRVFYNTIQFLNHLRFQNLNAVNEIKALVNQKLFDPPVLKDLFEILTKYSNEPLKTDVAILEKIKNEIPSNDETLRFYVGLAFYLNEKPDETASYLHDKINKIKASNELKLYCRTLFEGNGDKLELLSILEGLRKTQPLDYDLIRIELHIREVQRRWDIFVEIAGNALETFTSDESLIYALFLGYDNLCDIENIQNHLSLIENKDFKNERYGIAISGILLKAGLAEEAIELLYRTAIKKTNVQARSSYMTSLVNYPEGIFKDFPSVELGTYVEYEFNENSKVLVMDEENVQSDLGKALLNKTPGEIAILSNTTLSGKQITVRVVRVMNKYAALLNEIFKEAENPLSGYRMEVLKFEGTDVESMNKTMVKNFGAQGTMQKEFKEKEFEKYYNGLSSFTEIANSVFDKNKFDTYFNLTSPSGKRFMAISPSISNMQMLNDESKFVLDTTSVCLFFQLNKKLGLIFKHKFIISASLRRELFSLITETRMNPEAKLSLDITTEGVTPYFYQDGHKEGRLKFLEEILHWVDSNCVIDQVDEKLNFVLNIKSKANSNEDFLYDYVDNRLLVDRPKHILLSNDTFYYRHLNAGTAQVISAELYLEKFQNEMTHEYSAFMLKCNYVGITIYLEVLQDEFINMISGKENKFPICLENFGYVWNPNMQHAKVISKFLKWLYLSNSIILERKNQTANTLFLSALRNAPAAFQLTLHDEIQREFSLLGNLNIQIKLILIDALKIIRKTN